MKKMAILLAATVLLTTVLAGCSSKEKTTESKGTTASQSANSGDASKKEVVLKVSIWGVENYKTTLENVASKFTEQHPNIKVEVMLIPSNEYAQKLSIMAASKTAPDLAWMQYRTLDQFIDADQLLDIASLKTDAEYNFSDLNQNGLDFPQRGDKLYAVPFLNIPKVMFFNKTLFEAKGLKTPLDLYDEGKWTWDEFINTAKALSDPSKGVYGASFITANGWKVWSDNLTDLLWQFGADFISEDGQSFLLNSPEGEQALQAFSDMMFVDQIHPKPGDQTTFESGQIAMNRHNYGYSATIRDKVSSFEWDIAPVPTGPKDDIPLADGSAFYSIMKDSENPEEAMLFLKYITGAEGMAQMSKLFVPARISVLNSGVLTKEVTSPSARGVKAAIIDKMAPGKMASAPRHPNWQQLDVKMQTGFDYLYANGSSVKEVLDRMEKDITPLLK